MVINKPVRIMAVAPTSRGFGFAVMEGPNQLCSYGNKTILQNKNVRVLAWVEKFIRLYQPSILILPDVNAGDTNRAARIKTLHRQLGILARKQQIKIKLFTVSKVHEHLLGTRKGTKQAMADKLAALFPEHLQSRLPPKRRPWMSEDPRMDIFDAVALSTAYWSPGKSFSHRLSGILVR
jgi:hypothetical protein